MSEQTDKNEFFQAVALLSKRLKNPTIAVQEVRIAKPDPLVGLSVVCRVVDWHQGKKPGTGSGFATIIGINRRVSLYLNAFRVLTQGDISVGTKIRCVVGHDPKSRSLIATRAEIYKPDAETEIPATKAGDSNPISEEKI
jgi:hypothetical protein